MSSAILHQHWAVRALGPDALDAADAAASAGGADASAAATAIKRAALVLEIIGSEGVVERADSDPQMTIQTEAAAAGAYRLRRSLTPPRGAYERGIWALQLLALARVGGEQDSPRIWLPGLPDGDTPGDHVSPWECCVVQRVLPAWLDIAFPEHPAIDGASPAIEALRLTNTERPSMRTVFDEGGRTALLRLAAHAHLVTATLALASDVAGTAQPDDDTAVETAIERAITCSSLAGALELDYVLHWLRTAARAVADDFTN